MIYESDECDNNETTQTELKILKQKMEVLEKKIDRILDLLESDCKKMRDHIDFVENVYDNVKTPFNYVMDSVNNLMFVNNNLALKNSEDTKSIMDDIR